MGTNLVVYENNQQIEISTDDIRKYVASDLNEKEFWMFIQTAKTYGLNPFKREIYAVKYGNTFSVITGYQVYLQRLISADILEYWEVEIEKPEPKNIDTWIGIFTAKRKDWTKEFVWKVAMKEVNKKQALWNLQPEFQLKKVAISQGCRMIAPEIVGGMPYISDELGIDESNSYEQKTTTEKQTEKPKTEMSAERESAEKAKSDYLAKLYATIAKFTTIEKINEYYNGKSATYKTSAFVDDIKLAFSERKQEIANSIMAKNMGVDIQDLIDFRKEMNGHGLDATLIRQVIDNTKEAVNELKQRIENWKKDRDEQRDAEAKGQAEETEPVETETELDALGDGEQELNANNQQ